MEAGTQAGQLRDSLPPLTKGTDLLQPENPAFVAPEIHMKELEERRVEAERALEFHAVRRDEAQSIIASCDSAIATMREITAAPTALRH